MVQKRPLIVGLAGGGVLAVVLIVTLSVVLTKPSAPMPASGAVDPQTFKEYTAVEKELYVWSHSINRQINGANAWSQLIKNVDGAFDKLVTFCKAHNFHRIYLYAGAIEWDWQDSYSQGKLPFHSYFLEDLKKLNENNIAVQLAIYINDDPNNLSNWERIEDVANVAKSLTGQYAVDAIHLDQEPYNSAAYENLILMFEKANAIFPTTTTLKPLWMRQKMVDLKPAFSAEFWTRFGSKELFVDTIQAVTAGTQLMAYNNVTSRVQDWITSYQTRCSQNGKPGTAIIELDWNPPPEEETLHYEYVKDPQRIFQFIVQEAKQRGLVLHHYAKLYYQFYCEDAASEVEIKTGIPIKCEE